MEEFKMVDLIPVVRRTSTPSTEDVDMVGESNHHPFFTHGH
jgi:hypothetical protein